MSTTEEWRSALIEWYDTLLEIARVFSVVGDDMVAEATTRAEHLDEFVKNFPSMFEGVFPKDVVHAPADARTAVADGLRVLDRLSAVRDVNSRLFIDETVTPTPGTVHFVTGMRTQTRQLGRLYTRMRSRIPALHDRQFAARVPREYALPLIENALTPRSAPIVMEGLTRLYEAGVPKEYVASAVDPATLDAERAERVVLAYRADLPPEYAGAMT